MNETADLIRRHCIFLDTQEGPNYLRHLRRILRSFWADYRIRPLLVDVHRDGADLVDAYRRHDNAQVEQLRGLRAEFARVFPEADDSTVPKPHATNPLRSNWHGSLAEFDEIAALPSTADHDRPISPLGLKDSSRCGRLSRILRTKLRALPDSESKDEIGSKLSDLELEHDYAHREFVNDRLTDASTALDQIFGAVNQMNRSPPLGQRTLAEMMKEVGRGLGSGDHNVETYLYEEFPTGDARVFGERLVSHLRPAMKRLEDELLLRVGTQRSLVALLQRFRVRCEWHDRDRLRQLAAGDKRRAEEILTAELSRWLFDEGLTPLSKPLAGGLEPDLLDPATLYVEAKRYRDASGARHHIVQGMWQVHDTIARLHGTPHAVKEAFYVVFREGGPRYLLPSSIFAEGYTVHTVLVDIAPLELAGSRQRQQPIFIPAEDLAPRAVLAERR